MCRRKGDFALQREHSHNCVLICVCARISVCVLCCASAKPTHPQAVDLYILFGLSVCPNIMHPSSPPSLSLLFWLAWWGHRLTMGLGTVNRTPSNTNKSGMWSCRTGFCAAKNERKAAQKSSHELTVKTFLNLFKKFTFSVSHLHTHTLFTSLNIPAACTGLSQWIMAQCGT